jgi:hypothetical protein
MSTAPVQKLLTPEDLARILGVPRLQIIRQSQTGSSRGIAES